MSTICGQRIKDRREKLKMTQGDLAGKIGYTESRNISNYEKGTRSPDFETLCRIADALSCTTDYLLGREDNDTHEAASVVEQTGLSAPAVDVLIGFKNDRDGSYIQSISALISDILLYENVVGLADAYHIWKGLLLSPAPPPPADIQIIPGQFESNAEKWREAMRTLFDHEHILTGARYDTAREFEAFLSDIEYIAKNPGGFEGRIVDIYQEEAMIKQFEEMNQKGDAVGIGNLLKSRRKENGKGEE